jgi:hypothetical protein
MYFNAPENKIMKNNKLLIYIIGDGRSGSTVLAEYLARNLNGFKIGEARWFWKRYYRAESYCECGKKINNCEYWGRVSRQLPPDLQNDRVFHKLNADAAKFKNLQKFLKEDTPNIEVKYVQDHFYEAIFETSPSNLVVDSSKLYWWGLYLDRFSKVKDNVLFVHLVRDIASTANSWKKDVTLPEYIDKEVKLEIRPMAKHLKVWLKANLVPMKYMKGQENYIYMDYKEFCNDPEKLLRKIKGNKLFKESSYGNKMKASHGIAGNPVKQGFSGNLQIKYHKSTKNLNIMEKTIYLAVRYFYLVFKRFNI